MPHDRDGFVLALGGGAGLGWAHIGVLSAFHENDVPICGVAGTSVGALVGSCLAFNRLEVLEEIARSVTRRRIASFLDVGVGGGSVLRGRRMAREIALHLGHDRLENSPIPISLVAADLLSGDEVRLVRGDAVAGVMASMAIPGIFPAVRIGDALLVDGGLVANVPMGAARALVPGRSMIAVDLMSDYAGHVGCWSSDGCLNRGLIGTVRSSYLIMVAQMTRLAREAHRPEVCIDLPVGHIATGDFTKAEELISAGRMAALAALSGIRRISPSIPAP